VVLKEGATFLFISDRESTYLFSAAAAGRGSSLLHAVRISFRTSSITLVAYGGNKVTATA
jgi:hypothetical protein